MKTFPLNSRILAGSAFLLVAGLLLGILMPTPAFAVALSSQYNHSTVNTVSNRYIFQTLGTGLTGDIQSISVRGDMIGSGYTGYLYVSLMRYANSDYTGFETSCELAQTTPYSNNVATDVLTTIPDYFTNCGSVVSLSATKYYAFRIDLGSDYADYRIRGSSASSYANGEAGIFSAGNPALVSGGSLADVADIFFVVDSTNTPSPEGSCSDGIMNQDETGIDVGGVCAVLTINTPVDGSTTNDFSAWSVSYSGIDVPVGYHQITVHWSDNETLLNTCVNDPLGSLYGGTWADSEGYSVCTNSVPKVVYDLNVISFTSGVSSYTGTVPKSKSLVDGKTYYAQAIITDNDGFNVYKSDVISFTMSGGVPVVAGSGTISNTGGSGLITGTSTHFLNTIKVGDVITVVSDGQSCKVLAVVSDTELQCTPLTSSHTTQAYTQNSEPSQGIDYEECSTFDVACGLKNVFKWLFSVSPATLNQFSNLSLATRSPFSYLYDVGTIFNELFANSGSMSYAVSASTPIGTINFISASAISAVPYASTIKTILGYMLYFFTAMTIYRLLLRVHNK